MPTLNSQGRGEAGLGTVPPPIFVARLCKNERESDEQAIMPIIANNKKAAAGGKKKAAAGGKKTAAAGSKKKTAASGSKKKAVAGKPGGARMRLQLGGGDCGGPVMLDPVMGMPYSVGNVLPNYAAAPSLTLLKSPIAYIDGATMGARHDYVVFPPIDNTNNPGDLNTQGGDFNLPLVAVPGATGGGLRKRRTTAPKRKPNTAPKNKKTVPKAAAAPKRAK